MDCSHWLNCAWMAVLRTKPALDFSPSLTQHCIATAVITSLQRRPSRGSGHCRADSKTSSKLNFRCLLLEHAFCEYSALLGYKWVTKNHRLTINQAFFGALRRIKTHISSKTEALFSSVPMEQRLMCRYLTAEK